MYFSNVASNKILLSFRMTIEVWKDDCLTFALELLDASALLEELEVDALKLQEEDRISNTQTISFSGVSFHSLGIWFNLLKAAIMPGAKMKLHLGMYYVCRQQKYQFSRQK